MVFVVAEIGINHNGDTNIVKKLIDIAVRTGCDAVKFQKRTVEKVYSKEILDYPRESPWGTTTREQKFGLEFDKKEYDEINSYTKEKGIEWFASAWDLDSQLFLRNYDLKHNKIASAMLTNLELLNAVAEEKKHTFVSTGMSSIDQINNAVEVFRKHNCPFELMHCNSTYPMNIAEANLNCIKSLREKFKCNVGYSGHELMGYLVCTTAVTLGATSIERHITVNRSMYGSDQAASLEEKGLDRMIRDIRLIDTILGDGIKKIWPSEIPVIKKLRADN